MGRRRLVIAVLLAAAVLLAMFGCAEQKDPAQAGAPTVIQYWTGWTGPDLEKMRALVDRYERERPGVRVQLLSVAGAYQKVRIAFAGGDAPDVCSALWPEDLADFVAHGYLEPLQKHLAASGRDLAEWYPAPRSMMMINERVYGVSLTSNPFFVLYNREQFREAGLPDGYRPRTMDEMTSLAVRLTKYDQSGAIERIGLMTPVIVEWGPLFGDGFYDEKTRRATTAAAGNVRALAWLRNLAGALGPARVLAFEQGGGNMQSGVNPFYNGRMAMYVSSIWEELQIRRYAPGLDWGFFPVPSEDGSREDASYVSGSMFVVSATSRHKAEAWDFLNWLSSPRQTNEFCVGIGNMPAVRAAASGPFFQTPIFTFAQRLLNSENSFGPPRMPFWNFYRTELVRAQERALHGGREPQSELAALQLRVQDKLDELFLRLKAAGVEAAL